MSIAKKPQSKKKNSEDDVNALIEKGGSAAVSAKTKPKKDVIPVTLRLPSEFESRIEAVLQNRALKIPRHTWILEAIVEKLEREEKK